jgi:tetratricopeptide (TPR) repeat protein
METRNTTLVRWGIGATAVVLAAALAWWSLQYAQARQNWNEARQALEQQDADRARVCVAPCLARWPDRIEVRLLAARAARVAEQYDEAEEHLAACERTSDADVEVRRERALLQAQQGDYRAALALFAPGGLGNPEIPLDVLAAVACGYESTFYYGQAVDLLARVVQQGSDHVQGNLVLGRVLIRMRWAEPARKCFETAVHRLPNARAPRLRLTECLLDLGDLADASVHLAVLGEHWPDDAEVAMAQARLQVYQGDPVAAQATLQRLLERQPKHTAALVEMGRLEYRHGEPAAALRWLEQAVQCNPDLPAAWEMMAFCHEAASQDAQARRCRAEMDRAQHALGEATRLKALATQERSNDLDLRNEIADHYERLHEPATAIRWRFCALQIDPDHLATHAALARLFAGNGQPHLAAYHQARSRS